MHFPLGLELLPLHINNFVNERKKERKKDKRERKTRKKERKTRKKYIINLVIPTQGVEQTELNDNK